MFHGHRSFHLKNTCVFLLVLRYAQEQAFFLQVFVGSAHPVGLAKVYHLHAPGMLRACSGSLWTRSKHAPGMLWTRSRHAPGMLLAHSELDINMISARSHHAISTLSVDPQLL